MRIFKRKYKTVREYKEIGVFGYTDKETIVYQHLIIKYYLFGVIIYSKIYHSERIPLFADLQNSILGSTDWVSTHSNIINKHIKLQDHGTD